MISLFPSFKLSSHSLLSVFDKGLLQGEGLEGVDVRHIHILTQAVMQMVSEPSTQGKVI